MPMKLIPIKKKLLSFMTVTLLASFAVVSVIVVWNMSSLVNRFLDLTDKRAEQVMDQMRTSSNNTQEKMREFYEDSLRSKGNNLMDKDLLVIKTPFLENSFQFVKTFLEKTLALDKEIVLASFFVLEGDDVKSWQYVNAQYPKGLGLKTFYKKSAKAWVSELDNGKKIEVPDDRVLEVIKSNQKTVTLIDYELTDAQGAKRTIKAYDCFIPVFDGEADEIGDVREAGDPIGFLRYVVTIEKMQAAIAFEEKQLAQSLIRLQEENRVATAQTNKIGVDSQKRSFVILGASALSIILIASLISLQVSTRLTSPILKLTESANRISNGNYDAPVNVESNDEIGILSHNFDTMRKKVKEFTEDLQRLVDERTRKLAQALEEVFTEKRKIQEILDHIEQGILTFREDLKIEDEFSRFVTTFYDKPKSQIAGMSVLDVVFPQAEVNGDMMNRLHESLKCMLGEDLLSWELNSIHLPNETSIHTPNGLRIIALDWKAIVDDSSTVQRVMLSIRDLTDQRALEKKVATQRAENERMMSKIAEIVPQKREIVINFVTDSKQRMAEITRILREETDQYLLFRELHTIKGGARTLGFKTLAMITHDIEELVQKSRAGGTLDKEKLDEELASLNSEINEYYRILITVLGIDLTSSQKHSTLSIPGVVSHNLEQIHRQIETTTVRLGGLDCIDHVLQWSYESFSDIEGLIMHALTNAVDHGYVLPAQGGAKVGPVSLDVRAEVTGNDVTITIADDGNGFDMSKIKELAERRHFKPGKGQTVLDVLFTDGLSTAGDVTLTSGRGIGLSAIRGIVEKYGGTVRIEQNKPRGAKIIATLPKEAVLRKSDSDSSYQAA